MPSRCRVAPSRASWDFFAGVEIELFAGIVAIPTCIYVCRFWRRDFLAEESWLA